MTEMPPPSAEPHPAGPGTAHPGELLDRFLARLGWHDEFAGGTRVVKIA